MKTKLVKFEAPKESTIYNPPLKVACILKGQYNLMAYIKGSEYPLVCKENSFKEPQDFLIEVPDEPQRMTCLQLLQLINRGGWIAKTFSGQITTNVSFDECSINDAVSNLIRVSRIDKIEWIEPTTDLLD